ncbi:MAG TPA: hypothetical protein ENO22_02670 [candidate division Zixibacteria bacterium]|nr:hypothetical protein [candidate division Zixibacteria bacterium]
MLSIKIMIKYQLTWLVMFSMATFTLSCSGGPGLSSYYNDKMNYDINQPTTVMPAKLGNESDLILPDALATELLKMGFNIVERSVVRQMVEEEGLDFTEILNGEEYFKLGTIVDIESIILVNSKMQGSGIANATVKIVELESGKILFSTSYSQPMPENPTYLRNDNILETAKRIAEEIEKGLNM